MKFRRVFIEITNECNLACGFCAVSAREPRRMTVEFFRMTLRRAGPLAGVVSLHVLGEPFMHPDLPEILKICSAAGVAVNLVTNATLLDKFGPALFEEPCLKQVSISLHALASLETRGREAALLSILRFARARPARVIASFRLRGDLRGVFERETAGRVFAEFGVTASALERGAVKLAPGVYFNSGPFFEWPGSARAERPPGGCLGLRHNCAILSDGRVVPCCADFDGRMTLGSIADSPLDEILAGPAAMRLRRAIASPDDRPDCCKTCGFRAPN
ncbi:MAG: radical SAM protein [Elusimicrobiaceae bacterium]|nr:radical SAM protein [Elusimicrobiaceae bacterium]